MIPTRVIIEEDCVVLLGRALLGQTLCAFGEDGCGQYGQHSTPMHFDVTEIQVDVDNVPPKFLTGKVSIALQGYDANVVGHIQTDQNFDISLNAALSASGVSTEALTWAPIDEQVDGCVTFYLNTEKLLG